MLTRVSISACIWHSRFSSIDLNQQNVSTVVMTCTSFRKTVVYSKTNQTYSFKSLKITFSS